MNAKLNPFKSDDLSYHATKPKLIELGYAPTSAKNPGRISKFGTQNVARASDFEISTDPTAVYCRPSERAGCDLADALDRQLAALVITAYGASNVATLKAIEGLLAEYKLAGGPVCRMPDGTLIRPFQYGGEKLIHEYRLRPGYADEELAVELRHSISNGPSMPAGSHVIALDGEWRAGDLLSTPRKKLPQLYAHDVDDLFQQIERARWDNRPAAT